METVEHILAFIESQPVYIGLLLLMLSAMIEYIVPPFPGDSVTIVGAVMIPAANWPWWGVLGAVMIGSVAGSMADWWVGLWVARNAERDTWIHRFLRREKVAPKIAKIKAQFNKGGAIYIATNRFLPAFRALFFLAAGLTELEARRVAFWSAVSALAWNLGLLGVGYLVGYNLDELVRIVDNYTTAVLIVLAVVVIVWIAWGRLRPEQSE